MLDRPQNLVLLPLEHCVRLEGLSGLSALGTRTSAVPAVSAVAGVAGVPGVGGVQPGATQPVQTVPSLDVHWDAGLVRMTPILKVPLPFNALALNVNQTAYAHRVLGFSFRHVPQTEQLF